jgi:multidrug efflux pump subunit AcrB
MGPAVENPVGIRIVGTKTADPETLRGYARQIQNVLRSTPGTWDVHDSWGTPGYRLDICVDEDRANLAGVSNAAVTQTLNAYLSGHHLSTFREDDHQVPIYLRLPGQQRSSLEAVDAVYVEGENGKVPIDAVAEIRPRWEPAKIERRELGRKIEVGAQVEEGWLANDVLAAALDRIEAIELDPAYRLEIGGEQEKTKDSQQQMRTSFAISLLLIVLCLVVQYNSLSKPLIILVTLPLAATGALVGLYVTGNPLGFMAMLGLLSLSGVVLNDAIVLIEFVEMLVEQKLKQGVDLAGPGEKSCAGLTRDAFRQCVVEGARMRILAICLTTLTTVGGLIPLALAGGPLFEPMAAVIIFGLLAATLLTLLVLPAVYAIFVETFGLRPIRLP